MNEFIQIGQAALRDPVTGDFLPAVPLYTERAQAEKIPEPDLQDIGSILAEKMRTYRRDTR